MCVCERSAGGLGGAPASEWLVGVLPYGLLVARSRPVGVHRESLPVAFKVWAFGALTSQLGDAAMYFALGWAASAHGGTAAGLVLSGIVLPRTALLLVGGVAGDRLGARRVMITGDAIMLVVAVVLGFIAWRSGTPLPLLLTAAVIIGIVDAFYLPSSGSMPRRLVGDADLARAVALRQSGSQLVSMIGGPIGGLVVAAVGFAAAAFGDAITFAVALVVLIAIRARIATPPAETRHNMLRDIHDGLKVVATTPGLRPALLLVAGAAGFILPVTSLLVPLVARAKGWGAGAAGLIIGAQSLGAIATTLLVARRGIRTRPGVTAVCGLLITAAGQVVLAFAHNPTLASVGAAMMGVGAGIFVSHLAPVLLGTAPRTHLARVQATLSLAQSLALLATNNILGNVAHSFHPANAIDLCAAALVLCAALGYASGPVRRITKPLSP